MARARRDGLLIAGGGLAGCLAALALARLRPDVPVTLVEEGQSFGGNHIWSFFDADVADGDRWLVDAFTAARWPDHEVVFPAHGRTLRQGYNSARSALLDAHVRATLGPERYRLGAKIVELGADEIALADGERLTGLGVIDARGAANLDLLDLGWQKFIGREYRFDAPHGRERPLIMDATVDQADGYRFVYCLPFSDQRMLIEDTYYADTPELDRGALGGKIDAYVARRGWSGAVEQEESGVLPVAMGGDFEAFWRSGDAGAAKIGLRGGFFHPTTGYSLPDAVRTAILLTRQRDFSGAALHDVMAREAARLWRARRFYRLLNRMLFRAAEPDRRYRILERFYRLDPALIARFYAGRSTFADKLRILSGRPPVPIGRAVRALTARPAST